MTDLYIKTPTQADYDALMRLAEAKGYMWLSGKKATALNLYNEYVKDGGQVIQFIVESKELMQCERDYFEKRGETIETIPNLATIKSIRKVTRDNRMPFIAAKWLPEHYKSAKAIYVIQAGDSTTYTNEGDDFIAALAVEYKPQESEEVMTGLTRLATPEIELPSDYKSLVNDIKAWNNINQKALLSVEANHSKLLANIILDNKWPANLLMNQVIRLIHIADVRFIDPKRKWHLKNENTEYSYIDFYTRNLKLMWGLYNGSVDLNGMTETEFKTSLASSKCPFVFEDFEAEEV